MTKKWKVIKSFADKKDGGYTYQVGEQYPRTGGVTDTDRIEELSSHVNRTGEPLIVEDASTELFITEEIIDDENENVHKLDKTFGEIADAYLKGNSVAILNSNPEVQNTYGNISQIVITKTGGGTVVVFYPVGQTTSVFEARGRDKYPSYDVDD